MPSNASSDLEIADDIGGPKPTGKTLLIADPDGAAVRRLSTALRKRGHRVLSVKDGSKALEVAVMRAPDLVLYDVGCPLLDARTFSEILGSNPRTAHIPVVLVGPDDAADRVRGGFRESFLQKPFNVDEVLARVAGLLRRVETAERVRKAGVLEGSLDQIAIPDLLQILSMNRRSGVLRIASSAGGGGGAKAELLVSSGRVSDARIGEISGEKALFRCLLWSSGTFTFAPGAPSGAGRIGLSMDEVLLEGMRQNDEIAVLEERAPTRDDVLTLVAPPERIPDGLHPVTEEVVRLLTYDRPCGEVLDQTRAPDLEVLRAVTTLVERGFVRVLGRAPSEAGGRPLVGPEVAFALHGRMVAGSGETMASLRLVVAAPSASRLAGLAAQMSGIAGWRPDPGPALADLGFGGLGEVRLGEAVRVVLTALPTADALSPLWRPYGAGAIGAVIVTGEETEALVRHLAAEGRRVVLVGEGATEQLPAAGSLGATAPTFVEGLGRLLEAVARGGSRRPIT
jgi:CheY-like chemotaxis protein